LDVTIDKFLILLSLWITEPASHIILECLIGIYEINVHNVDSLLKSVLTIHDSKVFFVFLINFNAKLILIYRFLRKL